MNLQKLAQIGEFPGVARLPFLPVLGLNNLVLGIVNNGFRCQSRGAQQHRAKHAKLVPE